MLGGLDEAGLGPVLGPLVVAGVALEGPVGVDPWRGLAPMVCRDRPARRKGGPGGRQPLFVADSKKVHSGPHGLMRLERTVLGFHAAGTGNGRIPRNLAEWLRSCGVDLDALADRPWYRGLESTPLPLAPGNDRESLELDAHLLRGRLEARGMRMLATVVHATDVVEFNRSIAATDNKSRTHFDCYAAVLDRLLDAVPADARIIADRCGGLMRYGPALRRALPNRRVRRVRETGPRSTYRVGRGDGEGSAELVFAKEAESAAFSTALASCFAKYLRETMMRAVNDWFGARCPGLKPTAGYYVDGHRFLDDIADLLRRESIERRILVRIR